MQRLFALILVVAVALVSAACRIPVEPIDVRLRVCLVDNDSIGPAAVDTTFTDCADLADSLKIIFTSP